MVRYILFAASIACLSTGAVVVSEKLPKRVLIARLEAQVHRRFQDVKTGNFGTSRLGEPYSTHSPAYSPSRKMLPENNEETAILQDLKPWDVVAMTASHSYRLVKGKDGLATVRVRVNGPVAISGDPEKEFSTGAIHPELEDAAKTALTTRPDGYEFDYRDWHFVTRQVIASKACISCHVKRDGHDVKVGDMIGIYLLGFRKH